MSIWQCFHVYHCHSLRFFLGSYCHYLQCPGHPFTPMSLSYSAARVVSDNPLTSLSTIWLQFVAFFFHESLLAPQVHPWEHLQGSLVSARAFVHPYFPHPSNSFSCSHLCASFVNAYEHPYYFPPCTHAGICGPPMLVPSRTPRSASSHQLSLVVLPFAYDTLCTKLAMSIL